MAYPTTLDNFTDPSAGDNLNSPSHAGLHTSVNSAVEAVQAKLGIDSSSVTTSHDYKLSGVTGSDKAASKAGTETLINKTLTSPVINTSISGTAILDDDTMATASATTVPTSESTKAYVDSLVRVDGWTSFIPSWTNLTVGNGTNSGAYTQIGKTVFLRINLLFGSTTSVSGDICFTHPVTSASYADTTPLGVARLHVGGSGYGGVALWTSTTS